MPDDPEARAIQASYGAGIMLAMALPGSPTLRRGLTAYRSTGAELPFGDPLPAHHVAVPPPAGSA
jgi:hypothetical protein